MNFDRKYEMRDLESIKNKCTCYLYYDAVLVMDDGRMVNGIIEKVDDENVGMLVAEGMEVDEENAMNNMGSNMNNSMNNPMNMNSNMSRQPRPGFNRYRRYGRRNYPIGRINRVGLVPFPIVPPIYPPYPIYPYPPYPYPPILPL